jgi:diacylglycerol kinase family enzyme
LTSAALIFWTAGSRPSRYFAQLAGAGLDARAVELVSWKLKKSAGPLAYVVAGFQALAEKQRANHRQRGRPKNRGRTWRCSATENFTAARSTFFPEAHLRTASWTPAFFRA